MLLNLFRFLMPRDDVFVPAFAAQAAKAVEAAQAFRNVLADAANAEAHHETLIRIEREADEVNRTTVGSIHRVFITPFDRGDILALTNGLDDIIDLMKTGSRRILLYRVPVMPPMLAMADCIVRACEQLRDGMPLLSDIAGNAARLAAVRDAVDAIESEADRALQAGLDEVFGGATTSPGHKLMVELVYEGIEAVADRCEDIVDLIHGIVIEQV
ncbi:DUF47 domain-containing protein [Muricoccus radiodurans]|uniref:DUF47 domain-containing protein n=1 Tax=Muricoccus radiodurans TaxID=2231721 RepID=UPI003CF2FF5E